MTFSHLFLRVDSHNLTSDTVVVAEGMTQMIPGITGMMIRLIGALILLIMMYPMFGYLILPAGLLLLGVNAVFRKILKNTGSRWKSADFFAGEPGRYAGDPRFWKGKPDRRECE